MRRELLPTTTHVPKQTKFSAMEKKKATKPATKFQPKVQWVASGGNVNANAKAVGILTDAARVSPKHGEARHNSSMYRTVPTAALTVRT